MTLEVQHRPLTELSSEQRSELAKVVETRYREFRARDLALDMTRGKPSPDQLDLSRGLLECVDSDSFRSDAGVDCRNYGVLEGLPEARRLFAAYLGVRQEQIVLGGNSSLQLMHDLVVQALLQPLPGAERPWQAATSRFLCPVPGYDRHFTILARYGIEAVPVAMGPDGPDVEEVERLVADDPSIKGMVCVPRYSNPSGCTYSDEVVERLVAMATAAADFRIWWDDAYTVHHHGGGADSLPNVLELSQRLGRPDRFFWFGSTSKLTYAGGGVSMVAASEADLAYILHARAAQTIGPDKLNQLRHVRFLRDRGGIEALADRHAEILGPRFQTVLDVLDQRLGGLDVAAWTRPRGGYFVCLDTWPGCARRVVELAAKAGVKLTPAGATFPGGVDPQDRNLRLAPSYPPAEDLRTATELLCDCVLLTSLEQLGER